MSEQDLPKGVASFEAHWRAKHPLEAQVADIKIEMENLQQQDAALDSQIARNEKALRENLELLTKVKSNYELEKTVSEECVTLAGLIAELQASKRVTEDTLRKGADLLKKKEDELALQKAPPPPWKKK